MGVFSKIKNWISNTFGGGSSGGGSSRSTSRASRVSNYGGGGSRSYRDYSGGGYQSDYQSYQRRRELERKERKKKQDKATQALASISKRTDALSSGRSATTAGGATSTGNGQQRVLAKLNERSKSTPPDPKQKAAQESRERTTATLKKISEDRKSYNKATGNKYNVDKNGLKARQAQKSQAYDVNAEKWETKQHPVATSFARGATSGVTFGGSELLAQTSKQRKKSGAEEYYQKNKSRGAEIAGEIAGSLAGFGLTGEASARAVGKLAPKALKSGSQKAATKLASKKLIQRAAEKEAIKRFGAEGATKEVIQQIAKRRAGQVMSELGKDAAINVTTGLASDLSRSYLDARDANGRIDPEKFGRSMAMSAGLNTVLGGATSLVPAFRVGRNFADDAIEGAVRNADDVARTVEPPRTLDDNVRVPLNRRRRTDVVMPEVRPQTTEEIAEQAAREVGIGNADNVAREIEPPPVREADARVTPPMDEQAIKEEAARAVGEDFPYEGTAEADDMMRRINDSKRRNAETYANEQAALEGRVKELEYEQQLSDADKPLRVNKVAEDTPIGGTTEGVRKAKSAYERNTGETLEGDVKSSWHEAWKASQEYHESHATGRDTRLSKTSVSQLHMMKSDAERELREKGIEEGWLSYNVIHTEDILDKVSKEFRDDPNRWVSEMIDVNSGRTLDFRETPEWQARAHYIMAVVDPTADSASEIAYTEAYKLATMMSSKAGQTNNLRRQFVQLTPAGRRDAIMDEMAQILYNSQGFANTHRDIPSDKYDALNYIKAFLEDDPEIEKRVKKLVEVGGLNRNADQGVEAATTAAKNASEQVDNATESVAKTADETATAPKSADEITLEDMAKTSDELPTEKPSVSTKHSTSDEIMQAHAELLKALNEKNPKTKFDVVQEIRYLNMLGNPKTHIRNIFGSGFFSPIRQISNMIRSGIERTSYVKNSGVDVTLHGGLSLTAIRDTWAKNPTSEAGKKALAAFEKLKPELLGSMKLDNQLYSGRAKHLSGKILDAVSDFNSNLLSKEDDFFKQKSFRENYIKIYERYRKSGTPITKKLERRIEDEAMQEAYIATFNEYNEFAKYLANITRKAGDPNASAIGKGIGIATNAVMPFTKVPANIMKQSVNYSPIGIVKGFSKMQNAIKKGNSEAMNQAIDELASGLTGSAIFGLGMLLGKTTDAFTTNVGKDDYAAKFKKQQGVQNYSVAFKNPTDGKTYSMTLDWLVPNSATFFAGVELANQMKSGDFNVFDLGGDWTQIMSRIVEPVMETSMLSGLYSMLESTRNGYGDDDKQSAASIMLRETAQSYLNSLVPTALGQTARTLYKNDKQISGENDWEYFKNQTKSKLGLGETNILGDELGADTTAYGDVKGEKKTAGDYGKSALKNFLSPANIQKVDLSELDKQKIKQYEDAVKDGADPQEMSYLFPKKQYKKQFTTGNLDVKMSNKDLSTYNQAKTTGGEEGARIALEGIMFNRYDKDEKGNKISRDDAYTPEQKQEIINSFKGKSLRDVEKWLYEQPQFKSATPAEQKKVIDHIWSLSNQGKSVGAKRVGEQAVIKAQGGDVNEYNFNNEITEKKRTALQPYIDAGIITYEDAVDFARYAGKTYYYEDDEGGHSQTYYNKGVMMDYLKSKGFTDEEAAALFNSFKASNAKEYGSSSYRRGRRRRGRRRGYRRYGGGGSTAKATVPKPKALKASSFTKGVALGSQKSKSSSGKAEPPMLKRVEAKIALPNKKR